MKALLAVVVLASAATVYADTTRSIYDIMYLPKAGTSFGFSEVEYSRDRTEFKGTDSKTVIKGFGFDQTVGHSFSDRLSAQASIGYGSYTSKTGSTEFDIDGLTDLNLSAKFRTMDEKYKWDLIGGVVAGLADSEVESNGDTNLAQGGSSVFLGTQFGSTFNGMQWAVLGQYKHNMKATTDVPGGEVEDDANGEFLLRADVLNKLAEKSFLRSHLDANFTETFEDDANGETVASTKYTLGTEFQHLCKANLLLRAGVDYSMVNHDANIVDNHSVWAFRLAANYQF